MDLSGKRMVVTGANNGIGFETAKALATRGAHVIMACRDARRADAARSQILAAAPKASVDVGILDLASFASIHAFADSLDGRIDVLVDNAGVYSRRRRETEDGLEWTFGINHIGHFLLTRRLLAKIPDGGRVVVVSSRAHYRGHLRFDDLQRERRLYVGWNAYADSKLANVLFARELARREPRLLVNSLHPGVSVTGIFREAPAWISAWLRKRTGSAADIAKTQIKLAASPDVEGRTGLFWKDEHPVTPAKEALDDDIARRLWAVSEELVAA